MKYFGFILPLFLFFACAIVKTPTGGPIDRNPPQPISISPPNFTTNFTEEKIIIQFDEYVDLKNVRTEVQIVPPFNVEPKIFVKGKRLIIELKDSQKENTTYSIFFGNAIADITEGNILQDFQYVFSTADYIDSLSVSGQVVDAYSLDPQKDIRVLLYPAGCDTCFFKTRPISFGTTNEKGMFSLKYLKAGEYSLYALEDQNNNFRYDPGEKVGFVKNDFELIHDTSDLKVLIFKEHDTVVGINELKYLENNKLLCVSRIGLSDFNFYEFDGHKKKAVEFYQVNRERDSIQFWVSDQGTKKIIIEIGDYFVDTLSPFIGRNLKNPAALDIRIQNDLSALYEGVFLVLNDPLIMMDTQKFHLFEDTLLINNVNLISDRQKSLFYKIDYDFKLGSTYNFVFLDSALQSFSGLFNDSLAVPLKIPDEKELGSIKIKIDNAKNTCPVLIALLNSRGTIERENTIEEGQTVEFSYYNLRPGNYRIRFIKDENQNQRWDAGRLEIRKKSEEVYYYDKEINLKPNWEISDLLFIIP